MGDAEPRIALVVAVAENGVIGRDGKLPWHISSDLKFFRRITMNKPVVRLREGTILSSRGMQDFVQRA